MFDNHIQNIIEYQPIYWISEFPYSLISVSAQATKYPYRSGPKLLEIILINMTVATDVFSFTSKKRIMGKNMEY